MPMELLIGAIELATKVVELATAIVVLMTTRGHARRKDKRR